MKLKVLTGWIIAKPCNFKEKKTAGGLILPDNSAESIRFVVGIVVACSGHTVLGNKLTPSQIKVGDFIYFDEISTRDFKINNEKYFSMPEEKIYSIVEFDNKELELLDVPRID